MLKPYIFVLLVLGMVAVGFPALSSTLSAPLQQRLTLAEGKTLVVAGSRIRARLSLERFYRERGFRPVWTDSAAHPMLDELFSAITQAEMHGLRPADYHQAALQKTLAQNDRDAVDLLATDAYLTLAAHLLGGRLDPVSIEPDWTANKRERDLVQYLEQALAQRRILESLQMLEPDAPAYRVLKEALGMYREAAHEGGWETIPPGPAMKLGDRGERVIALWERLHATGLLAAADMPTHEFDIKLETAVGMFQRRVGLEADGVVGAVTLRELNKRPVDRINQIRANLERWRWLPENLGRKHIRVNIADYRLEVRNDGRIERSHDIIVGRPYRKTPVFSGEISYVVLNPWWETPASLARQDKLPAFRKDPASVARLGFEVIGGDGKPLDSSGIDWHQYSAGNFPFRLRQRPGPQNALGQVKLMFPNQHNVYLHDTPARDLFRREERALSSGCVRVADAIGLTGWVLRENEDWGRDRIDGVLAGGRETRVNLATKVPVHILYFTAVTDPDGALRLISDVYGRDARLIAALENGVPGSNR